MSTVLNSFPLLYKITPRGVGAAGPAMLPWDMAVVNIWILLIWPQGCFDFILRNINMETSLVIFIFEKALLIQGELHLANLIP